MDNEDFSGCKPDIDGKVLTQPIVAAFASGQFSRVPVIDGTSHDGWRLFVARQYWTAFAKRGVPSSRGRVAWPRFGGASQQMLSLVPPRPQIETSSPPGTTAHSGRGRVRKPAGPLVIPQAGPAPAR